MSLEKLKISPDVFNGSGDRALAIAEGGPVLSRPVLRKAAVGLARGLVGNGVKPKDVVAFALPNTAEFVVLFVGVAKAAAIAAPLNPAYKASEFEFYLQDTSAKLLLMPPEGNKEAEAAAGKLRIPAFAVVLEGEQVQLAPLGAGQAPAVPSVLQLAKAVPEDVALFLHTSGTTSKPKGVPLLHRNLMTTVKNIIGTYELSATDSSYLVMPLFHVHGLMAGLLSALAAGGAVVLPKGGKFSAQSFWADVKEHNTTWYTAVPTIHQILLARAAQSDDYKGAGLRFIRSCSASLAAPVLEQLEQTFGVPVLEAYAMTEAAHQMTSNPLPKHGVRKPGSVGKGVNVEIAILADDGSLLPVGKVGEVCIKGQNVTPGYHNNKKANVEAFAHGWFHTGDQGMLDLDGYLTLTGRLKELINRGGEKISPLEVDSALLGHAAVAEAVAFAAPDEKYGEEVNAAVVLKEGAVATESEILATVKEHLGDFKVPQRLFISNSLPKTATGKIQRRFVAEHFLKPVSKL